MYCIGIDVGIQNLGICVYNLETNKVEEWKRVRLSSGRYMPSKNVEYVRDFISSNYHYFSNCSRLLIERQMRCNMRIVESVLQALFFDRTLVLSPRSIKVHFGISAKNYRGNKARAVEWAETFVSQNETRCSEGALSEWKTASKRDDLADSLLLVMYYLDTYSDTTTKNSDECPAIMPPATSAAADLRATT